jgi:hypothetical protein
MSKNRELDRQIAELMGYSVIVSDTYDYWYYSEKYKGEVPIPPFSISWEAMRLLVEWLQGRVGCIKFEFTRLDGVYVAILSPTRDLVRDVVADTAPLALCKAVLALPPEVLK